MNPKTRLTSILVVGLLLVAGAVQAQQTTTSAVLRLQMGERWRPRAEQCLGLLVLAPEVYRRLDAVPCTGAGIIDDGVLGQAPFNRASYRAVRDLFGMIASLNANTTLTTALYALQVRSIGMLVPQLPTVEGGTLDPLAVNLKFIIRPLAPRLRAFRRLIEDDELITPKLLPPRIGDNVRIDDLRAAENLTPPRVKDVRAVHSILQTLIGPTILTDVLSLAIDSGCVGPLKAE